MCFIYMYMYINIHTYVCTDIYIYIYIYIYIFVYTCFFNCDGRLRHGLVERHDALRQSLDLLAG